jgi:hypothetical protein
VIDIKLGYDPRADWSLIPPHMWGGLTRYLERGIPPGQFLCAVLNNDLVEAIKRADDTNMQRLPDYVRFLYNYVDNRAWGRPGCVDEWVARRGREQQAEAVHAGAEG